MLGNLNDVEIRGLYSISIQLFKLHTYFSPYEKYLKMIEKEIRLYYPLLSVTSIICPSMRNIREHVRARRRQKAKAKTKWNTSCDSLKQAVSNRRAVWCYPIPRPRAAASGRSTV